MFPNWTGWKSVKLLLTGLIAADGGLVAANNVPANVHDAAVMVGAVLAGAMAIVIGLSGTAMGPTVNKEEK